MARNFSNEPDVRMVVWLRAVESGALVVAAVIATTILAMWFFFPFDPSAPSLWSKMTANTAFGVLLSVISLALTMRQGFVWPRLGMVLGLVVLLLGAVTGAEYLAHASFGFDTLFPHKLNNKFPGRPSPQTTLGFTLLGLCMLTVRQTKNLWSRAADVGALLLLAFNFIMLGGEFFGAVDLIGISSRIILSPQTLLSFFCFSTVVLLRRAEQGDLLAVLVNIGIGSRMARQILPIALVMPFLLLAVEAYLFKSGLMGEPYAQSIVAASSATFVLCLITWMGWQINALERELRDLSLTDELTNVYNRRGFYFLGRQAIREAQRANSGLSLFFFDLDGLKHVNDLLGHETGSEMIKGFAGILLGTFRKSDIIGRVGGDEFAVITSRDNAMWIDSIHARLHMLTEAHNNDSARTYRVSFSTGYAELNPGQADTLDGMVTRADSLMYQDKARKKLAA